MVPRGAMDFITVVVKTAFNYVIRPRTSLDQARLKRLLSFLRSYLSRFKRRIRSDPAVRW